MFVPCMKSGCQPQKPNRQLNHNVIEGLEARF